MQLVQRSHLAVRVIQHVAPVRSALAHSRCAIIVDVLPLGCPANVPQHPTRDCARPFDAAQPATKSSSNGHLRSTGPLVPPMP